jgi:hypothetical protein
LKLKLLLVPFVAVCLGLFPFAARAGGFVEHFDKELVSDPGAHKGWAAFTGDGEAKLSFTQQDGHGVMIVDARNDRRGIWWAVIKRSVSSFIDRKALARPDRELRVEARIRSHTAPRRVNMSFNHTRTTDFHSNLMEYDLPDTGWHVISLTTKGFDALPADEVYVQLAMIDWGIDRFQLDVDYIEVSVVDPRKSGPDLGAPLSYRPQIPPLASYSNKLPVLEDAIVDSAYPWVNFKTWTDMSDGEHSPALSISSSQTIVLRWDLSAFQGRTPDGWGVLELTTESVQWAPTGLEEFGYLRVAEIVDGDPGWRRDTVTLESFLAGNERGRVLGRLAACASKADFGPEQGPRHLSAGRA